MSSGMRGGISTAKDTSVNGPSLADVLYSALMHFDAHLPVIADLEARISTIRDSL
jgi:hypothetical protein